MTYAAAAAAGGFALLAIAPAAQAQTWGQPVYLNAWGRPVGGTPLSEVEARSYVETGRWADGYSERPHVYVQAPAPAYGHYGRGYGAYGQDSYGYGRGRPYGRYGYGRSYAYGHDYRRSDSRVGYRDDWGDQDDRPPSSLSRRYGRDYGRGYGRDCGCGDVYLYDR
jgi:hypothetical protein